MMSEGEQEGFLWDFVGRKFCINTRWMNSGEGEFFFPENEGFFWTNHSLTTIETIFFFLNIFPSIKSIANISPSVERE
jgi:hypothetical protein